MDQLNNILQQAGAAGLDAAAQALGSGAQKETKGEDKKAQEQSARWSPALMIGGGLAALLVVVLLLRRK